MQSFTVDLLLKRIFYLMKVYMDYNATTPLEPEVIQAMTEAMQEAWGNPSSPYPAGRPRILSVQLGKALRR